LCVLAANAFRFVPDSNLQSLINDLPDAESARLFIERLSTEHPRDARKLAGDAGLLSDALALAAWSPLLATTLAQHPDYLQWLARERTQIRVKTREEIGEALARFGLTHSQLDPQVLLARFRRRELLRIYLRDIRDTNTIVEITEELSNLADAILEYALNLARQELDNRYGSPLRVDERGRRTSAHFCIVALGKLGSRELNYASDIDLLFLYSDDGTTSATGTRGETSNREYFIKLSETVARIVGKPTGEGAAYRVDLRLRPHGRDGTLASSLDEAVRYYRETAQAWELQALIRSRAAAGSETLYAKFAERVRHCVFRSEITVKDALANVRLAKQKIDSHHAQDAGGFNVKLGRGGIREIEFIAQALQLAHGGRDEWLRAPHTLISLGRLADRGRILPREQTQLSDAYAFLRTLEHRLQMEHGLQTHSLPDDVERRALVARRMNFKDMGALTQNANALAQLEHALERHTANVRAAYDRVFAHTTDVEEGYAAQVSRSGIAPPTQNEATRAANIDAASLNAPTVNTAHINTAHINTPFVETLLVETAGVDTRSFLEQPIDAETAATLSAARLLASRLMGFRSTAESGKVEAVAQRLRALAAETLNSHRALSLVARIASSLDKADEPRALSDARLAALVGLCGTSEFFGEMIASNPSLIASLPLREAKEAARDYRALLMAALEGEESFRGEISALRCEWAKLLVEIGALDAAGMIEMREANRRQTELAAASLDAALLIAQRELERRFGALQAAACLAVLGLGRLGGGGMDYGSDLDVVLVYDDTRPAPVAGLTHAEAYARLTEFFVAALSSITRDGYLYRVDLRLRPDGKNGATAIAARAFTDYLTERAVAWEWLAYVKLRAAGGERSWGAGVELKARDIIHARARAAGDEVLRVETRRVRERLEAEKTRRRGQTLDIKYGTGGMLDVYFATRYLQLRDSLPDKDDDRSTRATLEHLRAAGSINATDHVALRDGYAQLRKLDHYLRLIVGRSTRLPPADHHSLRDIARRMNYGGADALIESLTDSMKNIRAAYNRITGG
jgi:glutamate-ammonia-ligase adenylyltransferase